MEEMTKGREDRRQRTKRNKVQRRRSRHREEEAKS